MLTGLIAVPSIVTSCIDDSVFTTNTDTTIKAAEGFLFATTQTVDLKVTVDDKYNNAYYYKVEVYDNNPFSTDTTSSLLCAGVAKGTTDFATKIVLPTHLNTVYVKQIDPLNRSSVKAYSVGTSSSLNCDFGSVTTPSQASKVVQKAASVANPKSTDYPLPVSYTTLTSASVTLDGTNYFVPSNVSNSAISFGWKNNSALYVAGEVVFNQSFYIPGDCKLVVLPGGKVTFNTSAAFEQSGVVVAVYANGSLNINQGGGVGYNSLLINDGTTNLNAAYEVRSNGRMYNNGTLKGTQLTMTNNTNFTNTSAVTLSTGFIMNSNTTFVNNGTLEATGTLRTNNNTSIIYNNGHIKTNFYDMSAGGGVLYNNCSVECEDFANEGATINSASGTIIECQDFYANNTNITLNGNAIFRIASTSGTASSAVASGVNLNYNVVINGVQEGTDKPLFSIWKLNNKSAWQAVTLGGTMEYCLAAGNTPNANYYKSVSNSVSFVESPTVIIASTGCNNGGINNGAGGSPQNPEFPMVVSEDNQYVYAMEDLWPYMGDYDMNDIVFKIHNIKKTINADNKVIALSFDITPLASGSTLNVAAALQFEGVSPQNISSFSSTYNGAYAESGQQNANYILFPEVHKLFGKSSPVITNTYLKSPKYSSSTYTFSFGFSTPVSADQVVIDKMNFYSIVGEINSTDRHEIHMAGYNPSSKVKSATNSYKDENNMVWSIMVPVGSYKYPTEKSKISTAYPQFNTWATSGGTQAKDWYLHPSADGGYIYTK